MMRQMRSGMLGRSSGGSGLCANGFRFLRSSDPVRHPYTLEMSGTSARHSLFVVGDPLSK
jgi:hypothetical protein